MCKGRIGQLTIALGVLFLFAVIATPMVEGQKTKGKTRPAETKHLMAGINGPNCSALAKLLKAGPADDKAWADAVRHAALLNEMSYILMDDGRCPDKVWAGAAKTLRECSAKVLEAAQAKDAAAAQEAFKKMVGACSTCHKAHKG
jgi:hypothetical protein